MGDLYLAWHLDIYSSCQYIDEAITEYQIALESFIDSAEIYFKIGMAQFYKGDLDKAINYFDNAVSKDPKYAKAYYMLAETYTKKPDFWMPKSMQKSYPICAISKFLCTLPIA